MTQIKDKIKIVLVLHRPFGGGAERVMLHLVQHLDREKFDIKLFLFSRIGELTNLLPNDIPIVNLNISISGSNCLSEISTVIKLSKYLRKLRPDIIFSTPSYTNLITILAGKLSGTRASLIIRESAILSSYLNNYEDSEYFKPPHHSSPFRKLGLWVRKNLYRFFYSKAHIIVGSSEAMLNDLKSTLKIIPREGYKIIPNMINTQLIDNGLKISLLPKDLNLKVDKSIIISIGRLEREKGIENGILAVVELNKSLPCYYWILGAGPEEERLKTIVRTHAAENFIFFLGFQNNPYVFLKNADVFFLPSSSEGFPNALLEAMYVGLPGVVTRCNESMEKLYIDGTDGFVVDPGNTGQMVDALAKLITNKELSRRISEHVQLKARNFSAEKIIDQYEKLIVEATA